MNYGKVEERTSSRSRSPNTARRAATSAILTDILSRSDRAPTSRTADLGPESILIVPATLRMNTGITVQPLGCCNRINNGCGIGASFPAVSTWIAGLSQTGGSSLYGSGQLTY